MLLTARKASKSEPAVSTVVTGTARAVDILPMALAPNFETRASLMPAAAMGQLVQTIPYFENKKTGHANPRWTREHIAMRKADPGW
jgi:hypothetical protein